MLGIDFRSQNLTSKVDPLAVRVNLDNETNSRYHEVFKCFATTYYFKDNYG